MTMSLRVGRRRAMSRWPSSGESSLTSEAEARALGPPAMMYCTCCGAVEKVGRHSEASTAGVRPAELRRAGGEVGRALGGVQCGDTAGGACADVDQAAAVAHRAGDDIDHHGDFGK